MPGDKATSAAASSTSGNVFGAIGAAIGGSQTQQLLTVAVIGVSIFGLVALVLIAKKD
jgi:hypothetical protein